MQEIDVMGNKVNLKLLQTFLLVAENNSFREAADQVNRSQSAVSTQIKQLEDQVGVALFHRTTRKVKLTAEGQQLLTNTRRAIGEIEAGLRKLRELADMRRGRVALACSPTIAATRLPPILAAFEREYPGVRIVLQELKSAELFTALNDGRVDFAIGPVVGDGDFEFETILSERIHALVPKALMPDTRDNITFAELSALPIIQFYATTVMGKMIAEATKAQSISLDVHYHCIQGQTMVALAEAGLGATILTESAADNLRSSNLQKLLIVEPEITQPFGIIIVRGQMLSPAAKRLVDLVRKMLPAASRGSQQSRRRPKPMRKTE